MPSITCILLSAALFFSSIAVPLPYLPTSTNPAESSVSDSLSLQAPSVVLMEASTGTVLYEKDAHTSRHPASITKIMTLILIFDALESQSIALDDIVTVSEYAASMGGSQVFLEPGETQSVETMIKCISIASANDACVAMAEFISGSEEAFVTRMNERAAELGMQDTHFVNCCGLDTDGHMTSAYDVALMSRELTTKYPMIHDYCTIWMDTITHVTKRGSSEFGLTNTNKLIRQYEYATGLKTGSTNLAKYCVSATAEKDGIELIAVVMAAPDFKVRFQDAATLLNYGFANCSLYEDDTPPVLSRLPVSGGKEDSVSLHYDGSFRYLSTGDVNLSEIERSLQIPESIDAPVAANQQVGSLVYSYGNQTLGEIPILCSEAVERATYADRLLSLIQRFFSV
ncbi:MAG: D-alanyl-D-alanine carboxypeptidase family protein [Roseburia sp.]